MDQKKQSQSEFVRELTMKDIDNYDSLIADPQEAPPGYYAVRKRDITLQPGWCGENLCRHCDWRPHCDGVNHRCEDYDLIRPDGSELKGRRDGCSVIFKEL